MKRRHTQSRSLPQKKDYDSGPKPGLLWSRPHPWSNHLIQCSQVIPLIGGLKLRFGGLQLSLQRNILELVQDRA